MQIFIYINNKIHLLRVDKSLTIEDLHSMIRRKAKLSQSTFINHSYLTCHGSILRNGKGLQIKDYNIGENTTLFVI